MDEALLIAILQIIAIDIVLGGDNAIIIALACRNLPVHQRRLGALLGHVPADQEVQNIITICRKVPS